MAISKGVKENSGDFVATVRAYAIGDVPLERPEFVPNDHLCFEDALTLVGQTLFGDEWNGEGVRQCDTDPKHRGIFDIDDYAKTLGIAPSSLSQEQKEVASRKGQEHRATINKNAKELRAALRQMLYSSEVNGIVVTDDGKRLDLAKDVWLGRFGRNIIYDGTMAFPDENPATRGFLLINREELLHALAEMSRKTNSELLSKPPMKDVSEGNVKTFSKRKGRPPTAEWTKVLMTSAWWYEWHKPEKVADLERFMHRELEALGIEAGESTVRDHASRLIQAHQAWLDRAEK